MDASAEGFFWVVTEMSIEQSVSGRLIIFTYSKDVGEGGSSQRGGGEPTISFIDL